MFVYFFFLINTVNLLSLQKLLFFSPMTFKLSLKTSEILLFVSNNSIIENMITLKVTYAISHLYPSRVFFLIIKDGSVLSS